MALNLKKESWRLEKVGGLKGEACNMHGAQGGHGGGGES